VREIRVAAVTRITIVSAKKIGAMTTYGPTIVLSGAIGERTMVRPTPPSRGMRIVCMTGETRSTRTSPQEIIAVTQLALCQVTTGCRLNVVSMSLAKGPIAFVMREASMTTGVFTAYSRDATEIIISMAGLALRHIPT
jgi:hypothetical protein